MKRQNAIAGAALLLGVGAAGALGTLLSSRSRAPSQVPRPGRRRSVHSRMLDMGATAFQFRTPLRHVSSYLCGFHFYNGQPDRQVEAHHYCMHVSEDMHQCVVFDGNGADAKLIGVEYIISPRLFQRLPGEERRLWHSHTYEIISGSLVAPGLPRRAERDLMRKLVGTYGKTFHFWQVDRGDPLPLGVPQLMMAPTADGQLDPALVLERDARLRVSTPKRRWERSSIERPEKIPGADAWEFETPLQLTALPVEDAARPAEERINTRVTP